MTTMTERKTIGIQVTDKASKAVRRIAVNQGHDSEDFGLRVGVKGGGCSGLVYVLSIVENDPMETDRVVDDNGLRIFIDKRSYVYLAGTEFGLFGRAEREGVCVSESEREEGVRLRQFLRGLGVGGKEGNHEGLPLRGRGEKMDSCFRRNDVLGEGEEAQFRAFVERAGVYEDAGRGKVRAVGADVLDLLNRLSTNRVDNLEVGAGAPTIFTNEKGRIIDLVYVLNLGDFALLVTGAGAQGKVMEWVDRYTFIEDSELSDVNGFLVDAGGGGDRGPVRCWSRRRGWIWRVWGHFNR